MRHAARNPPSKRQTYSFTRVDHIHSYNLSLHKPLDMAYYSIETRLSLAVFIPGIAAFTPGIGFVCFH